MNLVEDALTSNGVLIKRAHQGDDAAWETLVRDNQESIYLRYFLFNLKYTFLK